jgi:hypothetical protein
MNGARDVQARFDAFRVQETQMALQADAANRAKEQALNLSLENLTNAYIQKQHDLATAKSHTDSMLQSFQAALAAANGAVGSDPAAPGGTNASAGPEHDILSSCAATLVKLAEEADGLEARIVGLQAYIKDVVQVQH